MTRIDVTPIEDMHAHLVRENVALREKLTAAALRHLAAETQAADNWQQVLDLREELANSQADARSWRAVALANGTTAQAHEELRFAAEEELAKAYDYALHFARAFMAKHYPENTKWEPLPDLIGILTQLDNMSTIASQFSDELAKVREVNAEQARIIAGKDERIRQLEERAEWLEGQTLKAQERLRISRSGE